MDIRSDIENVRALKVKLDKYDDKKERAKSRAIYGAPPGIDISGVRVLKKDKRENAIINYIEKAESWHEVFLKYKKEKDRIEEILFKYTDSTDYGILFEFITGVDIENITLGRRKNKNKELAISKAIDRLETAIEEQNNIFIDID